MIKLIKYLIFKLLGFKNYLRITQRTYLFLYKTGFLKFNSNYEYHYFVKHLINKGDVIIDIGANLGHYSLLFARWTGDSGKVISIEQIKTYNEIFNEQAIKHRNITLYPYILSSEEETVESASLPVKKPSVLFGNLDIINYIKCDIKEVEYTILLDIKDILSKFKPIVQVKASPDNEKKLLELFNELGYTPYKLNKFQLIPQNESDNPLPGDYIFIAESSPEP